MTKMLNSSAVYFMNNLYRSFKTIGLVGKPRNDINLQMHKNLFHWLTERGYQVIMEKMLLKNWGFLQKISQHLMKLVAKHSWLS